VLSSCVVVVPNSGIWAVAHFPEFWPADEHKMVCLVTGDIRVVEGVTHRRVLERAQEDQEWWVPEQWIKEVGE
jgi:hypothetical protein